MNPAQVQETQAQYGDCHRQYGDQSEQTLTELSSTVSPAAVWNLETHRVGTGGYMISQTVQVSSGC